MFGIECAAAELSLHIWILKIFQGGKFTVFFYSITQVANVTTVYETVRAYTKIYERMPMYAKICDRVLKPYPTPTQTQAKTDL